MSPHTRRPTPHSRRPKPPHFHRSLPPHQRHMAASYPTSPPPIPTALFGTPVSAPAPTVAGCPSTIPPPPPFSISPLDLTGYIECAINQVLSDAFRRAVDGAVENTISRAIIKAVDRAINSDVDDMHKLFTGQLDWSELPSVHLTSTQHRMLSKISPSHWNGSNPICMDVLDFAGRLCSTQHDGNSPASKFVDNLLCVTQDKVGMTEEGNPLYWNHRIVLFLNKRVEVEIDEESCSGILAGAAALVPSHIYKIHLFQSKSFTLDLQKLKSGNARIRELGETAKETVFEEMTE